MELVTKLSIQRGSDEKDKSLSVSEEVNICALSQPLTRLLTNTVTVSYSLTQWMIQSHTMSVSVTSALLESVTGWATQLHWSTHNETLTGRVSQSLSEWVTQSRQSVSVSGWLTHSVPDCEWVVFHLVQAKPFIAAIFIACDLYKLKTTREKQRLTTTTDLQVLFNWQLRYNIQQVFFSCTRQLVHKFHSHVTKVHLWLAELTKTC